ncbi:amino acid ABC transporter ATP-binding protein [Tuwongella immobilis]|uniref:ABC transporter domain-containing protein n=1 Tax=Tuwongella immobilis TaxID=692036 RepID=A0A6C2YTM6_9BACT|nr:amino acid ABC transporter ATP-binding protein [Tuwongella immobilis]VIP05088.1 glutamine abc transporter atp-binding protein : ABC-type polar amino acid transport system, ATPase component OS=Singulisphaera acidiphila (strain ATCC BAA-1392 / DSM 18658 / VKM B-2454 / MOB10) GN=Sinac_5233 PE=3 SV=1: ABC_tran [Tuwongella immobilis]VTS07532.1 glutamine abc transporter atp-binding protein : ABC-type polar amino acid transport system, ATPase component OS=Singulisphaera acidiphila (strain ATCC BAA-13
MTTPQPTAVAAPTSPSAGTSRSEVMIEITGLVKQHGTQIILNGIQMAVTTGEVAVLVGPSGGGKSTLMRCINGLETFQGGLIRVGSHLLKPGTDSTDRSLVPLRKQVGMVFQQFHLFPHLSVLDNVCIGPIHVLGMRREEAILQASELLRRVGLSEKASAKPGQLSGGQQQRVAIARTLAVRPAVILFDEPTSALDPQMALEVEGVIADLAKDGQTMLVVTHSMDFARRVATTVHRMKAGQIVQSGPPADVLSPTA